jgi:hypothetical protein
MKCSGHGRCDRALPHLATLEDPTSTSSSK